MTPTDLTTRPDPLTPPDCDLRDFAFMPLDVVRLRDSDLAMTAEADEFRCAVLLWCASWHQIPAASLPDDDKILAQYAGFGRVVKEWQKVRAGSLRGWVKCSDGRLYHAVVAEKANDAWLAKLRQRLATECSRIKKHNQRHPGANVPFPEFDEWFAAGCPVGQPLPVPGDCEPLSPGQTGIVPSDNKPASPGQSGDVPSETPSKGQGEGYRQGQGKLTTKTPGSDPRSYAQPESGAGDGIEPTPVGLLSKAMRDLGIMAQPADPRLIALAEQGVSVDTIRAACDDAKRSKPNERIAPAYVFAILERWARKASELNAAGAAGAAAPRASPRQAANANMQRLNDRLNGQHRHDQRDEPEIIDLNERPA